MSRALLLAGLLLIAAVATVAPASAETMGAGPVTACVDTDLDHGCSTWWANCHASVNTGGTGTTCVYPKAN